MTSQSPILVAIVGPTAVGKTHLAIQLAKTFKTEILSADSRQFYKEMSIGTAVPSNTELQEIPHHFIHSHSIKNEINVGDFEKQALALLETLFKKHRIVILVGGSGLFIKALCEGLDDLPQVPPEIREQLNQQFTQQGIIGLQQQLQTLDPEYYTEVDISNPQRVIRALEVCLFTQTPFSTFRQQQAAPRPFKIIPIGLHLPREQLYSQINQRVEQMIATGLVKEVQQLSPYRHQYALKTVGYTEIFDHLEGQISLNEAKNKIQQNTRRFAKRQITWFKKMRDIQWFNPNQLEEIQAYINTVLVSS